uniref:Uncharacterized protein n=2 Tax=Cacopsylla melanoneura TaxID=428564 RepID=A0A8D9EY47_9HEMI
MPLIFNVNSFLIPPPPLDIHPSVNCIFTWLVSKTTIKYVFHCVTIVTMFDVCPLPTAHWSHSRAVLPLFIFEVCTIMSSGLIITFVFLETWSPRVLGLGTTFILLITCLITFTLSA